MITILVIAALFALAVSAAGALIYRVVTAIKPEDRTYADKPPRLLLMVWPFIAVIAFYVGNRLSVEYRERTIRHLRKAELDYALSPQQWFAARIVYAVLIGFVVFLFGRWANWNSVVIPVLGTIFGYWFLEIWLRDRIKRIELLILKHLPTFLDMLTLAVESGCNLTVGINIAVDKTPESPLRRAFERLLREIRSGRSRVDALRMLADRLDNGPIGSLIIALVQAEKTGASVGTVLRAQSSQRTTERFMRAEKLALEAPVKMLGPLIFCIFPCTFVVIGFPVAIRMMNAFH